MKGLIGIREGALGVYGCYHNDNVFPLDTGYSINFLSHGTISIKKNIQNPILKLDNWELVENDKCRRTSWIV